MFRFKRETLHFKSTIVDNHAKQNNYIQAKDPRS